ncbi:MAG: M20 family metallopeptidase [Gemmatimonadota bacterium]|nr:M20 family metallopeptidase [Gemmatimonadota bacterium]
MTRAERTRPPEQEVVEPGRMLEHVRGLRSEFVDFLSRMASLESPTDEPERQRPVQRLIASALEDLGYEIRMVPGRGTGGHLYARPREREHGKHAQLLVGHTDTVWPVGTLETMPVRVDGDRLHGPGTLDMKGGLTQIVFALRALRELGIRPEVTPVVFVNSDEEVGSPDSRHHVRMLARRACRAFVLEPALGPDARVKTARKGIGRFEVAIRGRASHAGLDPGAGASAILELSHVIQRLHELNDPERGTTVNVGVIDGGIRPNVVAAAAKASVDARVRTMEDARALERAVNEIRAATPGVELEITGGIAVPPLERTPRNRALWTTARAVGAELGFDLDEGMAGGGSDGNTTSQFTATLDGLGCVGDGPHAVHEHIEIDPSLERCALLARLLLTPASEENV